MLPHTRMRLERNADYHESVVEQHKHLLEKQEHDSHEYQQAEPQAEQQQQQQKQQEHQTQQHKAIMQMHAEAAKMLRDLLNAEPLEPAIRQAQIDNTLVRDRGPVARTLMH